MKKLLAFSFSAIIATAVFIACNSSSDSSYTVAYSNVAVSKFALSEDDSVMANLDTVFFSIDLANGKIFNADSLPYGTPTNKLVPRLTMVEGASLATFTAPGASGNDTIYDYINNPEDSIDFSQGPVLLTVASLDGMVTKEYSVSVLVHTTKPDSLVWDKVAYRSLPSKFSSPAALGSASTLDKTYVLTTNGSEVCMAVTEDLFADNWSLNDITLPEDAEIESLTGTNSKLFIIANDGDLYSSEDDGASWTLESVKMNHIYGGYGDAVLGAYQDNGQWVMVRSDLDTTITFPEGMAVSGTSTPVRLSFPYSNTEQLIWAGGRTSKGSLINTVWGYDGNSVAKLSQSGFPEGLEGIIMVPFFTFTTSSLFVVTEHTVLFAFGGNNATENSSTLYVSMDNGLSWDEGDELLQLPDYVPAMTGSYAYVAETTFTSRSAGTWTSMPFKYRLPYGASLVNTKSRATEAITSWECPYIYVIGGYDATGNMYNSIWRATLNRLTYKPIY